MAESDHLKLVLFDIDGTLVLHVGSQKHIGWPRFLYAVKKVFNVEAEVDETINYDGSVDRSIIWDIVKTHGVTRAKFDRKFPLIIDALHEFALRQAQRRPHQLYQAIDDVVQLARLLSKQPNVAIGLMSGNVEKMAWWKLSHAGINGLFKFGLFSDAVDDRLSLARTAFNKANSFFGTEFMPEDITVIGDTVSDAKCAHTIGARCIIVTTGRHTDMLELQAEKPLFLVDSLMDARILKYFNITRLY